MTQYIKTSALNKGIQQKIFVHEYAVRDFTKTAAFIFGFLAFSIVKYDQATHSKSTLAKRIGCQRKTVQLAIISLVKAGWIVQIESATPSGYAFVFGDNLPEHVFHSYQALYNRMGKNKKHGFLIEIELSTFETEKKSNISRKNAAMWRSLAYLRGLIAYRNASYAHNSASNKTRAAYRTQTELANHLNVTLKTIKKYLKLLEDGGEVNIVKEGYNIYLDADGALMELVQKRFDFLKKCCYPTAY